MSPRVSSHSLREVEPNPVLPTLAIRASARGRRTSYRICGQSADRSLPPFRHACKILSALIRNLFHPIDAHIVSYANLNYALYRSKPSTLIYHLFVPSVPNGVNYQRVKPCGSLTPQPTCKLPQKPLPQTVCVTVSGFVAMWSPRTSRSACFPLLLSCNSLFGVRVSH